MKLSIRLSALAVMILVTGGCTKPETAPQPATTVSAAQDQTTKEQSQPAVAVEEKNTAPAAVIPAPPAPVKKETVKVTPVEATKAAPVVVVKPAPPAAVVAPPAKTITYKTTNGPVTFDHLQHSSNNSCNSCHPTVPPAKIVLDKEKAHQLCRGCHQENATGPTKCSGCHIKG